MLGNEYQDQGLVFSGEKGPPTRPWAPTRELERILERTGLVAMPTDELGMPTSNIKEQQGEREMRFKVVDGNDATKTEAAGGGDPTQGGYPRRYQLRCLAQ